MHSIFTSTFESDTIIIPLLQMKKLRPREVNSFKIRQLVSRKSDTELRQSGSRACLFNHDITLPLYSNSQMAE